MSTESVAVPQQEAADVGLRRDVGVIGLIWSSEGSIIGSGWLFGALFAAMAAGPAALISWIIAGVAVVILALVHAELGSMYPVAGGTARFPHYAFGNIAGASFGWFSWLQAVTVAPIEVLAVEGYATHWFPSLVHAAGPDKGLITPIGYVVAVVLMAAFTVVNFFGIRWFARVNNVLTWWKLAIPLLAIFVLFTQFHGSNFSVGGFMPFGVKGVLSAISSAGVMFAYLGFEQADQLAGEARNPQRDIPRAIIGAVIIGVIVYILLQVVFIGALPGSQLLKGFAGISDPGIINGPFAGLAGLIGLGWLALILRIDAVISPGGTGLIYTTSTSRVSYGLGRNRYFPAAFGKTDARGVPWLGLIFAFIMGLFFFLPFPSWHELVGFITSASVLMYAGAPLALGSFRQQVPDQARPYQMPAAKVLAPLAFVIANLIIYWSGWQTLWRLGVAIVIGYIVIALTWVFSKEQRPAVLDWKSAQWLPVYLVGMGVISYLGGFGGGTGIIGLWWDIIVVTVFSLIIYYWAMTTRLSTGKMLGYVGKVNPQE